MQMQDKFLNRARLATHAQTRSAAEGQQPASAAHEGADPLRVLRREAHPVGYDERPHATRNVRPSLRVLAVEKTAGQIAALPQVLFERHEFRAVVALTAGPPGVRPIR